jgi:hypothetical protein
MTKGERIFCTSLVIFLIIYITLYVSQASGYYDYRLHRRTELTQEQIKRFEEDIKAGKPIDVEEYLNIDLKNYNNSISRAGSSFSKFTSKYIKKGIEKIFEIFESLLS